MPTITGFIEITYKKHGKYIFQKIYIIPNEKKNVKYFLKDKYNLGRTVDDFLADKYLGDSHNILFVESNEFRNMRTIKYFLVNEIKLDLSTKKYFLDGDIPPKDSCKFCVRCKTLANSNKIRCVFYRKIITPKVTCIDFAE